MSGVCGFLVMKHPTILREMSSWGRSAVCNKPGVTKICEFCNHLRLPTIFHFIDYY
jgi:hypothetical protein